MKKTYLLLLLSGCCGNSLAQSKWNIYLGRQADSLYIRSEANGRTVDNYFFLHFSAFPKFYYQPAWKASSEKVNRAGLLLPAKSTYQQDHTGYMVFGNTTDSVIINYWLQTIVVRNGRSAVASIANIFSGEEQEEPFVWTKKSVVSGSICLGGQMYNFANNVLVMENDSLRMIPARNYIHHKTGKLKEGKKLKYENAVELVNQNKCIAALDPGAGTTRYFLSRSLDYTSRLVVSAFMFVQHFKIHDIDKEMLDSGVSLD